MGLRMDDIHTPTVPSGSVTGQGVANGVDKDKLSLMDLIAEKTKVEEELTALGSVLDSVCHSSQSHLPNQPATDMTFFPQHGVNMTTTLTTFDGYPRNDLDIAQSA